VSPWRSPVTPWPACPRLCAVWAFGATFAVFTVVNKVKSMRVTREVEQEGLDVPEFGMPAYPEDMAAAAEA
jgi:ammonium transporter, Amt family